MTIRQYLDRWNSTGAISAAQYERLSAVARRDRFSVFVELNALLYLGIVSFVTGVGWTIRTHFARLGDAAILSALTITFLASLYYCFSRAHPYSHDRVESPGFAFDYVLYLGCLIFGVELGYVEFRFHLLQDNWDHYLLLSSVVFFILAYRFDNRFVLSLALSTLAAWFGLRLSHVPWLEASLRLYALAYGACVAIAGIALQRAAIKPHFLEAYLHIAANVLLAALVSGIDGGHGWTYMFGLLIVAGISIVEGVRHRRFAFVVYGVVYGYVGISIRVIEAIRRDAPSFAYIAVSGTIVIVSLVLLARRFGREA